MERDSKGRFTNRGIVRRTGSHIINLTDTVVEAEQRRRILRKREDDKIVKEVSLLLRSEVTPDEVLIYLHDRVTSSDLTFAG